VCNVILFPKISGAFQELATDVNYGFWYHDTIHLVCEYLQRTNSFALYLFLLRCILMLVANLAVDISRLTMWLMCSPSHQHSLAYLPAVIVNCDCRFTVLTLWSISLHLGQQQFLNCSAGNSLEKSFLPDTMNTWPQYPDIDEIKVGASILVRFETYHLLYMIGHKSQPHRLPSVCAHAFFFFLIVQYMYSLYNNVHKVI
jgi:hypothetical protein